MKRLLRNKFLQALLIYRLIFYIAFWAASITFSTYICICFYPFQTARKFFLSQLIRQSASYVINSNEDQGDLTRLFSCNLPAMFSIINFVSTVIVVYNKLW